MKKTSKRRKSDRDDLRAEYQFDYSKSRPNRFARSRGKVVAVVLEPDVARVFDSSRAVNQALRSVIAAMPSRPRKSRARQRNAG